MTKEQQIQKAIKMMEKEGYEVNDLREMPFRVYREDSDCDFCCGAEGLIKTAQEVIPNRKEE